MAHKNTKDLWLEALPRKDGEAHKYDHGHAVVYGADTLSGATRLAVSACARMGAGLSTVLCNPEIADVYRASLPAHIMVRDNLEWRDARVSARLYGCGGVSRGAKISTNRPLVLDAEAIFCRPEVLNGGTVLTPHEGEFAKAFPNIEGSREERALKAAKESGAVIVLKGAETVIADTDGRVVVNEHASPYLATAGSGDVLAGMITGLLAQGMPAFEAACGAVWIHGDAALKFGAGLVASDLIELIPNVLQEELGFSAGMR